MTVKEILDAMDGWKEEERKQLMPLLNVFSGVSNATLDQFELIWDRERGYDEFVVEQNKVIRQCVALEMTPLGTDLRRTLGLEPLALETVL